MWFGYIAGSAIFVAPLMLLDAVIWRVSSGWGLAAGGAALAAGVVWAITQYRADGTEVDPITSPFEDAGTPHRLGVLVSTVVVLMIPAASVLLLSMSLVIHQLSAK